MSSSRSGSGSPPVSNDGNGNGQPSTSRAPRRELNRSRSGPRSGLPSARAEAAKSLLRQTTNPKSSEGGKRRALPARSRSANNPGGFQRSQSARRITTTAILTPEEEQEFDLGEFATPRHSFGERYVRSAVASAANTTQATLGHDLTQESSSSLSPRSKLARAQSTIIRRPTSRSRSPGRSKSPTRRTKSGSTNSGNGSHSNSPDQKPPSSPRPSPIRRAKSAGAHPHLQPQAPVLLDDSTSMHDEEVFSKPPPEGSSRSLHNSSVKSSNLHNSFVAKRFLVENDDEFDLGITAAPASASARDPLLNVAQLKFPTSLKGVGQIFDDPEDPMSKYDKSRQKKNRHSPQKRDSTIFATRQDLRDVDQSVNLMDVDAAKYESRHSNGSTGSRSPRPNRRGSISSIGTTLNKGRASMVEIFLGDQSESPFNPKNKKFRSVYTHEEETCWEKFTNCLQVLFRILCSLPMFIFVLAMGSGLILIPMILEGEPQSPADTVKTVAPTSPPASDATVSTVAPVVPPANDGGASPLFDASEVVARTQALQDILLESDLEDYGEAGLQALNWMAAYDPAMMALVKSAPVLERFALATVYFAMHPETTADSEVLGEAPQEEERHLAAGSTNEDTWMGEEDICFWEGIDCLEDRVVHLNASHTHMHGSLPEELTLLTELIELDLSHNQIHGTLPASYPTKLSNLEYVWLHVNQIEGTLPASIGEWSTVYHLDLGDNQLVGSLPAALGKLTQTRLLYLQKNNLEGSIPLELGHLPKIEYLYLGQNLLTGELPMDLLSRIKTVRDLRLEDNQLTGTFPPEMESLHRLQSLFLANNNLNGELPDVFDRLHSLVEMDLQSNAFQGTLPQSLGQASALEILRLESNQLSGTVPASWSGLTALEKIALDRNDLTGSIPLCSLTELTFLSADCTSKVACDCCSKCY